MRWSAVRQLLLLAALLLAAIIIWIDVNTQMWQEFVILSGLAAGIVTFVLTALVIDRVVAMSTRESWLPLTRLALSDILHTVADDSSSDFARGHIVAHLIDPVVDLPPDDLSAPLHSLRQEVLSERTRLSRAIAQWSSFLISNWDSESLLDHAAIIAEQLDTLRDMSMEVEREDRGTTLGDLNREIEKFNSSTTGLVDELHRALDTTKR